MRIALLEFYDIVIFHDVDEILIADPLIYSSLADYITTNAQKLETWKILGGVGVEIFHDAINEVRYDPTLAVLRQRKNASFRLPGCKPAIYYSDEANTPHGTTIPFTLDVNLWLLHLKFLDQDIMLSRQPTRNAAVERGEVPNFTRWALDPTELDNELARFISRPLDVDESRMRKFLSQNMRNVDDGCWIVDRNPVAPHKVFKAVNGLQAEAGKSLNEFRFVIPERFKEIV